MEHLFKNAMVVLMCSMFLQGATDYVCRQYGGTYNPTTSVCWIE